MRIVLPLLLAASLPLMAEVKFRPQEIQADFGVVYAVATADVNRDGKPDVIAINGTTLAWWENPAWTRHVILEGVTKKDNVCFSPHDIDRDGKLDFALGADWQPTNTQGGGSLQWVSHGGKVTPLGEEPTLHRIRWGDVDGDGKEELAVVPLHGRGTKAPDWEGDGARILVLTPPEDLSQPWSQELVDDTLHIVHNFIVTDGEIWVAAKEGVFAFKRYQANSWSKRQLGEGAPGEIKLGRVNRVRRLATIEPWHGSKVVIYTEPVAPYDPQVRTLTRPTPIPGQMWRREVIETNLVQGHALGWGDFDGDGSDELAAGWRNNGREKEYGIVYYKRTPEGKWARHEVDNGVAVEDLAVADLNGDGKPEIIAGGRATSNIRIYWNETQPEWPRHIITTGFANFTANAADFTGDGKPDVISGDLNGKEIYLFVAPGWRRITLHKGISLIHGEAMDVDGDGDLDYVGAQYSPGVLFWLERPANPLTDPWPYHEVDHSDRGGVHGIHGLFPCDVDRDGTMDIIANSGQPTGAFPNSIAWFKLTRGIPARGSTPARPPVWQRNLFAQGDAPGLSHYMGCGDVNKDGLVDIAAGAKMAPDGNWFAWWEQPAPVKGRPAASAWKKHVIATGQEGATNIQVGDLNNDGNPDFFATRGHGKGVVWYEAPSWTAHEIDPELTGPHSLVLRDIDGDGDLDAATCAKDSGVAALYLNNGKGEFSRQYLHEDQSAYDIRMIDMDGDGDLDLLIAGQEQRNVVWLENRTRTRPSR
ncbi:MAG: VCBS repeat-containing protein [Bryobacterales bacterium]|nr:VCBS repeat-containing protein [Bryobacterales bacterium]